MWSRPLDHQILAYLSRVDVVICRLPGCCVCPATPSPTRLVPVREEIYNSLMTSNHIHARWESPNSAS